MDGTFRLLTYFSCASRPRCNPCPCGHYGEPKRECRCNPMQVTRYRQRISGPLLDRIDLHVEVPNVDYKQMSSTAPEESSETIRQRVIAARTIQQNRYRNAGITSNSALTSKLLRQHCAIDSEASGMLEHAMTNLNSQAGFAGGSMVGLMVPHGCRQCEVISI